MLKLKNLSRLTDEIKKLKKKNKKIVWTNGCFDIIHKGHIDYLKKSKGFGDILVIGLNSDKSVKKIKGENRPYNNEKARAEILSAFHFVDYIVLFDDETPESVIKKLKPDILVKGADYKIKDIAGADFVLKNGGEVKTVKLTKGYSTSRILNRVRKTRLKVLCVIPARIGSTRLKEKPLVKIKGKNLIQYVYENALKSKKINKVIVATDSLKIKKACEKSGALVLMTSKTCESGTDRVYEAYKKLKEDFDIIVNLQGDEPLLTADLIDKALLPFFKNQKTQIVSLYSPLKKEEDIKNPNNVKVVLTETRSEKRALYFSRSVIPYIRDKNGKASYFKHIGLYIYKKEVLEKIVKLPPSPLEKAEKLEQLRFLQNGFSITMVKTAKKIIGVDTDADIEKIISLL